MGSLAGRLPCLGVLSRVPSITAEDGVAGEQPIAMETVHPVAMRILAGLGFVFYFFIFFFPSLPLFCETSTLIRERALRMYDPCKHRVPIDQAPLLLGVCAGSRNKGRRKEGRKLPSTAPSK